MVEVIIMSPLALLVVLPYTANRLHGCSVNAMSVLKSDASLSLYFRLLTFRWRNMYNCIRIEGE